MITIGLDVGGTKVLGVAVDSAAPASPLAEERVPTPDGGAGLVDALVGLADRLAARCSEHGPVTAMGVGEIGRATSALQSLMRKSYAVFCLQKKTHAANTYKPQQHTSTTN